MKIDLYLKLFRRENSISILIFYSVIRNTKHAIFHICFITLNYTNMVWCLHGSLCYFIFSQQLVRTREELCIVYIIWTHRS